MAISEVTATINGTEHTLTYNSTTQKWEKSITAPNVTSYNLSGGYYPVTVTAKSTAGTTATETASENNALKLVVKEKVKPVITLLSPTNGAYVANSQQPITFRVLDEVNGSGVNNSTITLKIDGTAVSGITKTAITNGYNCSYTPATALSNGSHTIVINASDNDGNNATAVSATYTVDTIPPTLNITSPADNFITATGTVTVAGTTNDATSSPVTVAITVNSTSAGAVTVASNGSFSKSVTLTEGSNAIVVTAMDGANKATSVNLTVTLDTSVPNISSITITPNPADAGATMLVSVAVS